MRERQVLSAKAAAGLIGCTARSVNRIYRSGRCLGETPLGARAMVVVEKSRLGAWGLVPRRARRRGTAAPG